jgi:hypothetical protein
MDWQLIGNSNQKAVDLVIMVEAGTHVREMDPMKNEEMERALYVNI